MSSMLVGSSRALRSALGIFLTQIIQILLGWVCVLDVARAVGPYGIPSLSLKRGRSPPNRIVGEAFRKKERARPCEQHPSYVISSALKYIEIYVAPVRSIGPSFVELELVFPSYITHRKLHQLKPRQIQPSLSRPNQMYRSCERQVDILGSSRIQLGLVISFRIQLDKDSAGQIQLDQFHIAGSSLVKLYKVTPITSIARYRGTQSARVRSIRPSLVEPEQVRSSYIMLGRVISSRRRLDQVNSRQIQQALSRANQMYRSSEIYADIVGPSQIQLGLARSSKILVAQVSPSQIQLLIFQLCAHPHGIPYASLPQ